MANFEPAVKKTILAEGGFFYNHTTGEVVNMGVTLATLRSLGILHSTGTPSKEDVAFVKSLTADEAKDIYRKEYWDPLHLDHINDQAVAAKVFDLAVNMGVVSAARFLQASCGVAEDGVVGPITIARANAMDPVALLGSIRARASNRYQEIASANPTLVGNLHGWLSRLNS